MGRELNSGCWPWACRVYFPDFWNCRNCPWNIHYCCCPFCCYWPDIAGDNLHYRSRHGLQDCKLHIQHRIVRLCRWRQAAQRLQQGHNAECLFKKSPAPEYLKIFFFEFSLTNNENVVSRR